MYSLLTRFARYAYLAGIVLAIVLVVPVVWFPFQLAKVAVFAACMALAFLLFVAGGGARELVRAHGFKLALLVALLPLTYLLSAYMSIDRGLAFMGYSIEVDTVLFVTLGFLAFLLSFVLFRTLRTAQLLIQTVFWAAVAAAVFQLVVLMFGTSLVPFDVFTDRSANVVGKWNDFSLLIGVLLVFVLTRLELSRVSTARKAFLGACAVVGVFLLAVINFSPIWWLLLVASLALAFISFMTNRSENAAVAASNSYATTPWMHRVPWFASAGVAMAVLGLMFGGALNTGLTGVLPVSSLEVRPSYDSTMHVITAARQNPLQIFLGTGPDTFTHTWLAHKSVDINQTPFWSLDFNIGFSTILTVLGTVGFLGVLAWLVPVALLVAGIIRAVRLSVLSREERITAATMSLGALLLFAALVLYVPSPGLVLITFVLCGAAFGFLWRQGRHTNQEASEVSRFGQVGVLAVLIVLIALPLWSGLTANRFFISQAYASAGSYALQSGDIDTAFARAASAQGVWKTPDSVRLEVQAGASKINNLISTETAPSAQVQQQFNDLVTGTVTAGKELIAISPLDYRSYIALAQVYDLLAALNVEGAYDSAKQAYEAAAVQNPTSPAIPLALARLEASKNNKDTTQTYLAQALTLKPNYTDAILMVVQLNIANNDIPSAIQAAQAAAQTAPGIAPIWFELGLLHYANNDMANAIPALEAAVSLVPDYANAKYFLGLAYYAQNRPQEAIQQFQDLSVSNPESTEVVLILNNMRTGKPPFDSAQPPITDNPEERATAPLSE